jgi:fructose-1,6-bisphosphatase
MRTIADSYRGGVAVTPSDSTVLATTRGLYMGGAGNVTVDFADGTSAVLTAVIVGTIYPISIIRVKATGTTATAIVAIY